MKLRCVCGAFLSPSKGICEQCGKRLLRIIRQGHTYKSDTQVYSWVGPVLRDKHTLRKMLMTLDEVVSVTVSRMMLEVQIVPAVTWEYIEVHILRALCQTMEVGIHLFYVGTRDKKTGDVTWDDALHSTAPESYDNVLIEEKKDPEAPE